MNQATQAEQIRDEAIEQFNEDMSNACTGADRKQATWALAERLCNMVEAMRLYNDWMAQQAQAAREVQQ